MNDLMLGGSGRLLSVDQQPFIKGGCGAVSQQLIQVCELAFLGDLVLGVANKHATSGASPPAQVWFGPQDSLPV